VKDGCENEVGAAGHCFMPHFCVGHTMPVLFGTSVFLESCTLYHDALTESLKSLRPLPLRA
jgi:hypothetical protein